MDQHFALAKNGAELGKCVAEDEDSAKGKFTKSLKARIFQTWKDGGYKITTNQEKEEKMTRKRTPKGKADAGKNVKKEVKVEVEAPEKKVDDFKESNTGAVTVKDEKKEPAKKTRAEVFAGMMRNGGGTKKELTEKMIKEYGGSENEAEFQIAILTRLLLTMDYATKDESGSIQLVK